MDGQTDLEHTRADRTWKVETGKCVILTMGLDLELLRGTGSQQTHVNHLGQRCSGLWERRQGWHATTCHQPQA